MPTNVLQSMYKHTYSVGLMILATSLLSSCGTPGRYHVSQDYAPTRKPTQYELNDAIPTGEQPGKRGNSPYVVFGKRYVPMKQAFNFTEQGIASWYGSKFHGHLTSNGEIYDMFAMSAAHKTLPLPSYVKVTNLDNGKTVVVRVNDRGPFHHGRILDLSYSAAYKIGLTSTGTAPIKLEVVTQESLNKPVLSPELIPVSTTDTNNASTMTEVVAESVTEALPTETIADDPTPSTDEKGFYVQVLAGEDKLKLLEKSRVIKLLYNVDTRIIYDQVFKLLIGPFEERKDARTMNLQLRQSGYEQSFIKFLAK